MVTGPCAPQRRCLGCAFTLARSIPSSGIPACPWSGRCACLCRAHSAPSALEAHSFDSPARTDPNHSSCASTLAKPGPRPLVRVRGVSAERSVWYLRMPVSRSLFTHSSCACACRVQVSCLQRGVGSARGRRRQASAPDRSRLVPLRRCARLPSHGVFRLLCRPFVAFAKACESFALRVRPASALASLLCYSHAPAFSPRRLSRGLPDASRSPSPSLQETTAKFSTYSCSARFLAKP